MRKLIILLSLLLMLPAMTHAQDSRQRAGSTIIADALAQMPAENPDTYNKLMAEIASTGAQGIEDLALMLAPVAKGENAPIEYALYGVTAFSIAPGNEAARTAVRTGLKNAINKTSDNENRAFLLTLLQNCATADDAPVFMAFLADPYLQEWAVNGLIHVPGTEELLLGLVNTEAAPRTVLAKAAAKKGLAKAEPILLQWAAEAPEAEKKDFYKSLAIVGSEKSLPLLFKAAKAQNFDWVSNSATESYATLINRMAENGNKKAAAKAARSLMKATDKSHIRSAALNAVIKAEGAKALPLVVKAMKDPDRAYRVEALRSIQPFADDATYTALNKLLADKKTPAEVKTDIVNWYGATDATARTENILPLLDSGNQELTEATIKSLGILGGEKALYALTSLLGGPESEAATAALTHFNGKVNPGIMKALAGNAETQKAALRIASLRHMTEATPTILALAKSTDPALSKAAAEALAGVAEPSDFTAIAQLAVNTTPETLPAFQNAMKKSLRNLSGEEQFNTVKTLLDKNTLVSRAIFYPVLAQSGTDEAVAELKKGYDGKWKQQAFDALLTVNNPVMINTLFDIASTDKANADKALSRYATLVRESSETPGAKSRLYCRALDIASTPATQNALISGLAATDTYPAFTTAASYLDKPENAMTAAEAVRAIASHNLGAFDTATMRRVLTKAIEVFKADGNADSGYAVDDINGMLSKLSAASVQEYTLSPEEEAEGFKLLFDGHSLDNWIGNTVDYVPVDGDIRVAAKYGSGGNLYTKDQYSDFILRFEFLFEDAGVNNGIGIRTPMNVDAAYEGMEIQILDHDAPIYKGLRDYQVHGSVYGIIPAKRIKHRPIGEWGVEEIRAVGDHITVTVNGEVIVDGNIRKACKGHNVDPDGTGNNPYTVDHLNHPGLFNKSGHIAFCGHGPGVRFRNIRVKDLSKPDRK